jgi:hypothetical protein
MIASACVCVQNILRESLYTEHRKPESQEGGLCDYTYKASIRRAVNYTTTETMHFASSSVSEPNKSTSTLLALSGWSK